MWKAEQIKDLESLREFLKNYFAGRKVRLYLFGSRARGDETPSSDIDLAIEAQEDISEDISYLSEVLEESLLPYRVELVDLSKAGRHLRKKVMEEGILWIG